MPVPAPAPDSSSASPDSLVRETLRWTDRPPERVSVAIVGGGYSGLLTAIHILTRSPDATVAIFERLPRALPGVAYGAADEAHLLNVRAGRMGVLPSDPSGFTAWLNQRFPGQFAASDFVHRRRFGEYLNEFVLAALAPFRDRVRFVHDGVASLIDDARGSTLQLASGGSTSADVVVLALGLPAPAAAWDESPDARGAHCMRDPWAPDAYEGLAPDDPVTILGTGLTALDVLVSLTRRHHRGAITFVSRHGRFPLPHAEPATTPTPVTVDTAELAAGPRRALRELRRAAARAIAAGRPWQEALDATQPHVAATWRRWTDADRARFLARIRPMWEVHRHRAPVPVLQLVESGVRRRQIEVIRGTIARTERSGHGWSVEILAADGTRCRRSAARVFHCIGPALRVSENPDPLMRALLASGRITTDAASIGVRADAQGRTIGRHGEPQPHLLVVGALRRGDLWESTAVPDLRGQAEAAGIAAVEAIGGRSSHSPRQSETSR